MPYYIGVDLGGTNIKGGVVDEQFTICNQHSVPTHGDRDPDHVIFQIADLTLELADQANLPMSEIAAVGIGAPGPLDFEAGVIRAAPNMPKWKNYPIRDRVAEVTGKRTILENDGNAAAFGEFCAGAGRDPSVQHLVMLTLGTGVGCGMIIDSQLVHGSDGNGGEAGHLIVQPDGRPCGCGQHGCLEAYASATQVARRAQEAAANHPTSKLGDIGPLDNITAEHVFTAAAEGDLVASQIIEQTGYFLGIACVNLCRLLDPQMIVLSGGMSKAGKQLFEPIRHAFSSENWRMSEPTVSIVPAQLGVNAGIIGAAAAACNTN